MNRHIDDVVESFDGLRPNARGWVARCPAHEDRSPSLSIAYGSKALLVTCHAGCTFDQILNAAGLQPQQLFYDYDPHHTLSHPPRTSRSEANRRVAAIQRRIDGEPTPLPVDRLDDLLWAAYPTHPLRIAWWGVEWYPYSCYPFDQVMAEWVIVSDSAVFGYIEPQWVSWGRPDWHATKRTILQELIRCRRRPPSTVT